MDLLFFSLLQALVVEEFYERHFQILSVVCNGSRMVGVYLACLPTEDVLQKSFRHIARISKGAAVVLGDLNARRIRRARQANRNGRVYGHGPTAITSR